MSGTEMNFTDKIKAWLQHWGVIAGTVLAAFLIGFVPMWITARHNAAERDAAKTQSQRSEISNLLSSSIVDARRSEYETARQEASEFLCDCALRTKRATTAF